MMCGFAGYLSSQAPRQDAAALLTNMGQTIASRGPDSHDVWYDASAGIGLSHRRLAIVDLSLAGAQPMHSASGRYVLVFNGEIYNHMDLRGLLGELAWRGHSDTETLLAGFDTWGVAATLQRCIGMFAFAVWCKKTRTLALGRDRLGEKPLYYGWQGSGPSSVFLFGSELSTLKAHPAFAAPIDRGALALLMRHNYVPAPYSIYQGVSKLPPGCVLQVSLARPDATPEPYWRLTEVIARQAPSRTSAHNPTEVVDDLENLLKDAVSRQMMADVPLGAFLSGGVDSSTVVALMQSITKERGGDPVKTFTIGFREAGYDEAEYAKAVAQHLGTQHTELYVTPEQSMQVIQQLPKLYCEPFADSSQIPTFLVSQLARQHVTVALSGDAGDELFAGYSRYELAQNWWRRMAVIPKPIRHIVAGAINRLSPDRWNSLQAYLPGATAYANFGHKMHKGAAALSSETSDELYMALISHQGDPASWVLGSVEPTTVITDLQAELQGLSDIERMMALDAVSYLPDDILVKVDRAGMGVSLESRIPFLDHRVVEFAWGLPMSMKLRDGETKWPLRQVLFRHVPRALIERPKMGFGVPLDEWLRGPLLAWADDLLDETRLKNEGFWNVALVRKHWGEHVSGKRNWMGTVWNVLMFQAWLQEQDGG
jgi:asparagine synthase (glutamine-hydrolysing)